MHEIQIPHLRKLVKDDYLTLFENAIVEKFGFEYNTDNANISWHDLDVIRQEVNKTPYKFYYAKETYEEILNELRNYIKDCIEQDFPYCDVDETDIDTKDLEDILKDYSEDSSIQLAVKKKIEIMLEEKSRDIEKE